MTNPGNRVRNLISTATAVSLVAAPLALVATVSTAVPAQAADPISINLIGVNDFHGRINANTTKWATTLESLKSPTAAANLVVGAGDLIGASEFASASAGDQPTIDVMNALGLNASAVGNHEFDKGWPDLRDRVIANKTNAKWDYLGANVYLKGTQSPVLPEYASYDVGSLKVAVVGAVTQEVPSLVTPAGITDLDFGDPVAAVNRVAARLSDGDAANGEADVIVATFHAGAEKGEGSSHAAEVAKPGEYQRMAGLDKNVDAIFNGHTHQVYAWDAPVPGVDGKTRPILQTGSYAANVGQVTLNVDPDTGDVVSYTAANHKAADAADLTKPAVAKVDEIVKAALAKAKEVGNQPVGRLTADITRAYKGVAPDGKPLEDRGAESTLGDLVADALRDGLPASAGKADLGIVNPGGLRADLTFAGNPAENPANTDGVITYAEANDVLPFVNNVWTVDLTGAQLKAVLEQQWQPAGSDRPYLHLGLSDNVEVTQDPSKPQGQRITSVRINDAWLDPAKTYKVSTYSFLATGGDNFTAFKLGTSRDTGLVDRDVWIGYLQGHPVSPDFARQQTAVTKIADRLLTAGEKVKAKVTGLDLTSKGAVANTSVDVVRVRNGKRKVMKSVPVRSGSAQVNFEVPGGAAVELVAKPSNTTITRDVKKIRAKVTRVDAFPKKIRANHTRPRVRVLMTARNGGLVKGKVQIRVNGRRYVAVLQKVPGTKRSKAKFFLPRFKKAGVHTIRVKYLGNPQYRPHKKIYQVRVQRR